MAAQLLVANALVCVVFAGMALVANSIFGATRASLWFALSNVSRALAYGLLALNLFYSVRGVRLFYLMLLVAGMAMLHRTFLEQLDRPRLLWRMQLALCALAATGAVYLAYRPSHFPVGESLTIAVAGVQAALTAAALFSFSGEGIDRAGWFAGSSLGIYALASLMRTAVLLRFGRPGFAEAHARAWLLSLYASLLVSAATAGGLLLIQSGKMRLELLWRAQIDELTGLLNRWAFKRIAVKEVFRAMRTRGRLAVVMMDLDGMKRVNDQLGHGCGDAVLQTVSATLQEALRERDSIARMGGDEFCILLPDTDLGEAVTVAERLCTQIEQLAIHYRNETVKVSASFGVSSSERSGWNWQNLVDQADAALYEAKRGGRMRVVAAETALAEALVEDDEAVPEPVSERRRR